MFFSKIILSILSVSLLTAVHSMDADLISTESFERDRHLYTIPKEIWNEIIFDHGILQLQDFITIRAVNSYFKMLIINPAEKISMRSVINPIVYIFPCLKELDLRWSPNFTDNALSRLTDLTSLNLRSNKIITDNALTGLTNLTVLDLSWNWTITDNALTHLTGVRILTLERTDNITIDALIKLTKLECLNLPDDNKIADDALTNLTMLKRLNLYSRIHCAAIRNPRCFLKSLTGLTSLNIVNNYEIRISTLKHLTNLTELELGIDEDSWDMPKYSIKPHHLTQLEKLNNIIWQEDFLELKSYSSVEENSDEEEGSDEDFDDDEDFVYDGDSCNDADSDGDYILK